MRLSSSCHQRAAGGGDIEINLVRGALTMVVPW